MEKPCTGRVPEDSAPLTSSRYKPLTARVLRHAIFMLVFRSVFPLQLTALNSDGVDLHRPTI